MCLLRENVICESVERERERVVLCCVSRGEMEELNGEEEVETNILN